ncbi:MAG: shikimate dehydrogenase [Sphingomonadaceae bacterium]|nr:shikimate dehydrogenase [Sphingomonadaceae bacterium]
MTVPYAEVIGDPIAQSKSPAIHGFWLAQLGIAAEYRACHVTAEGLAAYIAARRSDPAWRGCNVTMPHKQAVMPLLDALDPEAERIGAVNTVVRGADGRLTGYNTDAPGFIEPVLPLLGDQEYRFAYVIGTGGAARAIIDALFHHEFLIWSISRNPAKARAEFFDYLGRDEDFLLDLATLPAGPLRPADPEVFSLVINATPLGMTGHPPLDLPWGGFFANSVVYDIVTSPLDTQFLQDARAQSLATIDGLAMLIGQAAVAFEKFFGQPAPRRADAELRSLLTK